MIKVNMKKAKDIWRDKLREERAPMLQKLDVEAMKNITNSEKLVEIEARKQALRDITKDPRIDGAETVEELVLVTCSGAYDRETGNFLPPVNDDQSVATSGL